MTTQVAGLSAAQKRRLDKLADDLAENALREIAHGGEIGDWKHDADIPWEVADTAYGYLCDRLADWVFVVGSVRRMRSGR